jgi:hypothetical protein
MTDVEKLVSKAWKARVIVRIGTVLLVCVATAGLAAAIVANVVNGQQDTTLERFSACEADATGDLCQSIRREAAEAQTLTVACLTLEQAGYPCPKPGSRVAVQQAQAASDGPAVTRETSESAADQAPAAGSPGVSAPHLSHHQPSHTQNPGSGADPAEAPESQPADPVDGTQPEQPGGTSRHSSTSSDSALIPSTVDAVGDTLSTTGAAVDHTLCTAFELLNHACSE